MWERKKHTAPQKRIDSLIGAGTVVNGDVVRGFDEPGLRAAITRALAG